MNNQSSASLGNLLAGIYGDIKSGKTTWALTAPKPIFYLDFDLSFDRAIWRLPYTHKLIDNISELGPALSSGVDIVRKIYPVPIKWPGQASLGNLQLWDNTIVPDFMAIYNEPRVVSIVIDTGTLMWNVDHQAHLERVSVGKSRTSLLPVEYARPNADMRALIGAARHMQRNLIMIHHVGGVYETRAHKRGTQIVTEDVRIGDTWAGWKEMGSLVDFVVRTYTKELTGRDDLGNPIFRTVMPFQVIETCGLTLKAEGMLVKDPTFDNVKGAIELLRSIAD